MDRKIELKSTKAPSKLDLRGASESVSENVSKKFDFGSFVDSENEVHSRAGAQFSCFQGLPKNTPKRLPKRSQNGPQIRLKALQGRSRTASKNKSKNNTKNDAPRAPNWRPNGRPNGDPKTTWEAKVGSRTPLGVPGCSWEPLGAPGDHFGTHF